MLEIADIPLEPTKPDLPGTVLVRPSADEVIDAAAADLLIQAWNCVRTFGDFHFAISASAEIEPFVRRLMFDPALRDFPWKRTHVWHVDDAVLDPGSSEEPRARRLHELLVEHADIPEDQVHAFDAALPSSAAAYEMQLREHLGWREKGHDRLDCVLVAISGDAPHGRLSAAHAAQPDKPALVGEAQVGGRRWIGMTLRLLNASRFIAVLALGETQRPRVASLTQGSVHPGGGLRPLGGELRWYLDAAACPTT